ncbi:MAG: 7-cyano-7-deazaguanine synthase QueC, partial [Deltaproteobacteria bacterium]|nr:7-cyano-7-deazaguanine synthase QueC [Deltaproteobacteria bacterium]
LAREEGFEPIALTVDYGQRHRVELEAARRVACAQGVRDHRLVAVDLRALGGSALTDDLPVPAGRSEEDLGKSSEIPISYVPARNTILLGLALELAEVTGASDIFIGVNAVDYSGYPDCRPQFLDAFQVLARVATRAGVQGQPLRIRAPLLFRSKAEIAREAVRLGVDLALTHTCYDPDEQGRACSRCEACQLRARGFAAAGLPDPTVYSPR